MQALSQAENAELAAVVDINPDAADAMAREAGCPGYASVTEMFRADTEISAAVVCTPPVTHPEICSELLKAGIHVLCEKPLAIDMDGAFEMVEAAESSGALLTMASKFRCVEDVRTAKAMLDDGVIGDVVLFENAFTSHVDMSNRWNSRPEISGGGVLIDNGTHSLDLARFFLGPIDQLQVIEGIRSQELPVEETVAIHFHSRAGVVGSIDLSWTINKELPNYITLHGSKGTIALGWRESKWKIHGGEWQVFGTGFDKVKAFVHQIENFARAILGEEKLIITIADGLASVRAIEAAYAALNNEPWVAVKSPDWAGRVPKVAGLTLNA
jgi:predicted dehydrogenase